MCLCPQNTPVINQYEAVAYGAHAYRVNGLINDCGRIVNEGKQVMGWFDLSTLKAYRIEGKKTMGLELAEQFGWELPDAIFYPNWWYRLDWYVESVSELSELGWLSDKMPRMFSVQSDGCAAIVKAFEDEEKHAEPFANAQSVASGIRVPAAVGDFMILEAVRQSQAAVSVEKLALGNGCGWEWAERISICPETGACIGGGKMPGGRDS